MRRKLKSPLVDPLEQIILGGPLGPLQKDAERVRRLLKSMAPPGRKEEASDLFKILFLETQDNIRIALRRLGEIPFRFTDKL